MKRWLPIIVFLAACGGIAGATTGDDFRGVWKMRHLFVTAVAGVERDGNAIHGVARVYGLSGKVDTYHFSGTVLEDRIEASHADGHFFRGRLVGPEEVSGVLITKTGIRLDIRAERCQPSTSSASTSGECEGRSR